MDPLKDRELKAAIERIGELAMELYDLIENGMTIDFTFPDDGIIVVPGKLPTIKRLIVTKPALHIGLSAKPRAFGADESLKKK